MRHGTIVIDEKRCKTCQYCVLFCPQHVISIDTTQLNIAGYHPAQLIDPNHQCTGCAVCAVVCPDVCITVLVEPTKQASTAKE